MNMDFSNTQRSEIASRITIGSGTSLGVGRNCDSEERFMGHSLLDLTNKTAVVIGGTSGIGLTIAKGLAQAGANVVPTGRRGELVQAAAADIKKSGGKSLAISSDVTDRGSLEALLNATVGEFGAADILVNSAGTTQRTPPLDLP